MMATTEVVLIKAIIIDRTNIEAVTIVNGINYTKECGNVQVTFGLTLTYELLR